MTSRGTQEELAEALSHGVNVSETTPQAPTGSPSEVLAANPERRLLIIENRGSNDIHLAFGGVTAGNASLTLAVGEAIHFTRPVPVNAVNAVADTGATDMYIMEG